VVDEKYPEDYRDFIMRISAMYVKDRLGYNGNDEISNHPFFKGIDWD